MHRELLSLQLERLQLLDEQIAKLNGMIAQALKPQEEAVARLAEVPGFGVDSAQQVISEVGVRAKTFPSAAQLTSWVGTCPGKEESAEENHNSRSAKGNRYLAGTESGGPRCGQEERQLLPSGIPPAAASTGLQVCHLGHRPSALPRGLEDLA
jgi:transposase